MLLDAAMSSGRLPSDGSIREALFLSVWLRRQEIEAAKVQLFAQSVVDTIVGKDAVGTTKAFKNVMQLMFPHLQDVTSQRDVDLKKVMESEAAKGKIIFSPITSKGLRPTVQKAVPENLLPKKRTQRK